MDKQTGRQTDRHQLISLLVNVSVSKMTSIRVHRAAGSHYSLESGMSIHDVSVHSSKMWTVGSKLQRQTDRQTYSTSNNTQLQVLLGVIILDTALSLQSSTIEQVLDILIGILSWEIAEVVSPCFRRGL